MLAIFAVVLWHSGFVSSLSALVDGYFPVVLTGYLVWWVGVPYFFIVAGYFFGQSILTYGNPIAQLRRYVSPLTWIFIGWMCIYMIVPPGWPSEVYHHGWWQLFYSTALKNMHLLATQNISLFLQGYYPVFHLWFLPALMFSFVALTLVAICRVQRYLILLIVCLYALALTEEIIGGHLFNTIHLGSWSIATLLTAIGWWLVGRKQPSVAMAWSMIVGGYALALIEGTIMNTVVHSSSEAIKWHFFLGGIILGVGIFLLALAKPKLGESTPFPFLAQFTLGVYASHILVRYTLDPIIWRLHVPLRGALVGIVVYALSILLTVVLARLPVVRYLVVKPAQRYQLKV